MNMSESSKKKQKTCPISPKEFYMHWSLSYDWFTALYAMSWREPSWIALWGPSYRGNSVLTSIVYVRDNWTSTAPQNPLQDGGEGRSELALHTINLSSIPGTVYISPARLKE